jgi:hypothetical protein
MEYGRALISLPRDRRPDPAFIRRLCARARAIYQRLRIDRKIEEAERLMTQALPRDGINRS